MRIAIPNDQNRDHVFTVEDYGDGSYQSVFPEPLAEESASHPSLTEAVKHLISVRDEYPGADRWALDPELNAVELLWADFGNVDIDVDGRIEEPWMRFTEGARREWVWEWFEYAFNVSVAEDLMFRA